MIASVRSPNPDWSMGFTPGPFDTTPDIVVRYAVSPGLEVVLDVRISALELEHPSKFFVLPKRFAPIVPAKVIAIRVLVPPRLPIAPNRSLRLTSVLFRDEHVGTFVREDVFPSTPDTSMLVIWPYELPSIVLSPGADWPSWWWNGAPQ